jgi:hypothetical protein
MSRASIVINVDGVGASAARPTRYMALALLAIMAMVPVA